MNWRAIAATTLAMATTATLTWAWSDGIYLDESIPVGLEENLDHTREVGPGVSEGQTYSYLEPWHVSWVTIQRSEDIYRWRAMSSHDRVEGNERLSLIVPRSVEGDWQPLAAINADFWARGGRPVGLGVFDGRLMTLGNGRPAVAQTTDGELHMDRFHFDADIEAGEEEVTITDINMPANRMDTPMGVIVYTAESRHPDFPAWPPARLDGDTEWAAIGFRDSDGDDFNINVELEGELFAVDETAVAEDWPEDLLIIVGYGGSADLVEALEPGAEAEVDVECDEFALPALWALGGGPVLVSDGEVVVNEDGEPGFSSAFVTNYHPRSVIGWNDDEVILMVIDGRQPGLSRGMSLTECAEWMQAQGMTHAMNYDGGGSSSLWVRGQTASRPSDAGGERSVTNGLVLQTQASLTDLAVDAPADEFDLHSISEWTMFPDNLSVVIGETMILHPRAWDAEGSRVRVPREAVRLEIVPEGIAAISRDERDRLILTGDGGGEAELRIVCSESDEMLAAFELLVGRQETVMVEGFEEGDLPELRLVNCTEDATTLSWVDAPVFEGARALAVDYDMPHSGGVSAAYIDLDVELPEGVRRAGVQVYGDGVQAWLRGVITDADGEKFVVDFTNGTQGVNWEDSWRWVSADVTNLRAHWDNPEARPNEPFTFATIYLAQTRAELKGSGRVVLDVVGASIFTPEPEAQD